MNASRAVRLAGLVGLAGALIGMSRQRHAEPLPANWRLVFRQAALQIPFDSDRSPERDSSKALSIEAQNQISDLRIAAARTTDTGRVGRIDSRITSRIGYPDLGIAPGVNYVWKDFVNGRMRLLVIPADTGWKMHWLIVRSHNHAPAPWPRLVVVTDAATTGQSSVQAYRICNCTTNCTPPMSWCNACDTSHVRLAAPVDAFRQYFARNKVAWIQR